MIYTIATDTGGQRLSHVRCAKHDEMPPFNDRAEGAECGACCLDQAADALSERFETAKAIYQSIVNQAIERMNLMSPGAGDQWKQLIIRDLAEINEGQKMGGETVDPNVTPS